MSQRIESAKVSEILRYLRVKKTKGPSLAEAVYLTFPGKTQPGIWEGVMISSVQFFDGNGNAVISATPDGEIMAAQLTTALGQCVWVRQGHEAMLDSNPFATLPRVSALQ